MRQIISSVGANERSGAHGLCFVSSLHLNTSRRTIFTGWVYVSTERPDYTMKALMLIYYTSTEIQFASFTSVAVVLQRNPPGQRSSSWRAASASSDSPPASRSAHHSRRIPVHEAPGQRANHMHAVLVDRLQDLRHVREVVHAAGRVEQLV